MSNDLLAIPAEAGFTLELPSAQVARITLNRPEKLNSQNATMWRWLAQVGVDLPGTVRVVVVAGAGRAFSAGLDRALFTPEGIHSPDGIFAIAESGQEQAEATIASFQRAFGWLARPDLISVAAVQGHAIGGGFQLALACDLRVVATDAQFTMAEPSLGIVPDLGGTKRLVELVGYSRAADLCLTGRRVPAQEADQLGLVSRLCAPQELATVTEEVVRQLLAVNRDAGIETKALLLAASGRSQAEQEMAERAAQFRRLTDLRALMNGD